MVQISIHALLAESDVKCCAAKSRAQTISIHALLAESDRSHCRLSLLLNEFLSTLSLRRATTHPVKVTDCHIYFYPRSPCGERQKRYYPHQSRIRFLSTLSLRRATRPQYSFARHFVISIHALLAESDFTLPPFVRVYLSDFYPRSPCGERQPRSRKTDRPLLFLSTLSLRRATGGKIQDPGKILISIHALLAESDIHSCSRPLQQSNFYPRSPCGERRPTRQETHQ